MSRRPETAITGIILAGGASSRFGLDKASAELAGRSMLDRVASAMATVCERVIVVCAADQLLPPLCVPVEVLVDDLPGRGPLPALMAGLRASETALSFVTSCDVPLLVPTLIAGLAALAEGYDAVLPEVDGHLQPLAAVYQRRCLAAFEVVFAAGTSSVLRACADLRVRSVPESRLRLVDPELLSFINVNTPAELARVAALLASRPGA